jgi:glucose-6-phosphate 1-dehydrogenase
MPVLERWMNTEDATFPNYAAGGQGPASSERLLAADGREWRKI